ncbi:hypothetical protein [Actinoalloteichus hymeniacidonis]|uniref:hypothetical protein n=1 Tax=Actinoalloteichus hymeniacidonis TaxID=340345 RepID=UPI0012FB1DAA|nr:hypothetical protein [Actinoalloteichus hymeniacidonis]MBB5910927.1 DnaJ-class molecular chaperone [Actinoalloteichus hymeniacidonis]
MSEEHFESTLPGPRPKLSTICPSCEGSGQIVEPALAMLGNVGRTVHHLRPCPYCQESGYLPGLYPMA